MDARPGRRSELHAEGVEHGLQRLRLGLQRIEPRQRIRDGGGRRQDRRGPRHQGERRAGDEPAPGQGVSVGQACPPA